MGSVRKPIIIRSKHLSTYNVAEMLGVSRKRTDELITMAHETGAKDRVHMKHTAKVNGSVTAASRRTRTRAKSTPPMAQSGTSEQRVGN